MDSVLSQKTTCSEHNSSVENGELLYFNLNVGPDEDSHNSSKMCAAHSTGLDIVLMTPAAAKTLMMV